MSPLRRFLIVLVPPFAIAFASASEGQPLPDSRTYANPTIKGVRLDWCRNTGRNCGKPAADLFCREQGLGEATRFERDASSGARGETTLVFGDGRTCRGPACSRFRSITCIAKLPAGPLKPAAPAATEKLSDPASRSRAPEAGVPPARPSVPARSVELPPKIGITPIGPIAPPLPAGARLFYCSGGSCEFQLTSNIDLDPKAPAARQSFFWDVSKIAGAGAIHWQIASRPFPAFARAHADFEPAGLVSSGSGNGQQGGFEVDFKKLAAAASKPPEILYVRVLPLATVGTSEAIGQPSNIVRVLYGAAAPDQSKSPFIGLETTAFRVELTNFEYHPYQLIERWPPGCKDIPTDQRRTGFDAALHALEEVWNFASEAYQWVKSRAVDLAGTLTAGLLPRQYLEVALDGALVAVGIPPDVPNFGEMMRSGVDGIAKEMAKGVVDQLPASQLAPTLGNLATDIAVAGREDDD